MENKLVGFLEGYGVPASDHELVLGTFDRGPTVFDQQVRALNLVHRLYKENIIPADRPIAVVGAGVAGLTFAAGALWLGKKVLLLEKQPVPCHLQRGCDIRSVHPHIYHWPRAGAEQPYAGLPLLSWTEGTASEVARQITTQWDRLRRAAGVRLTEIYSARFRFLSKNPYRIEWQGVRESIDEQGIRESRDEQGSTEVCLVVYAVGFGVEDGHSSVKAHSYWENDSFNQLKPDNPTGATLSWLVSGMGDGALIDLQRLTIESFRQGRVIQELFSGQEELIDELRTVAAMERSDFCRSIHRLAEAGKLNQVDARLRARQRKDTEVSLNGKRGSFPDAIDHSHASFSNKLLAHRLHAIDAFKYRDGELWDVQRRRTTHDKCYGVTLVQKDERTVRLFEFDQVVLRHGTRRSLWLERASYPNCAELEDAVKNQPASATPEWEPGWWSFRVDKDLLADLHGSRVVASYGTVPDDAAIDKVAVHDKVVGADPAPREFLTPVTEAVATTFVRLLAGLLRHHQPNERFRITLHRVVPLNGRLTLQQISEYAGTRLDDSPPRSQRMTEIEGSAMQVGTVGRVFDANHLTVGLCVRKRRPCLLRSNVSPGAGLASDLIADMNKLHIDQSYARHMKSTVRTVLTAPIFASTWNVDGPMVSIVLYVDSDDNAFFTKEVVDELYAACMSFRQNVDQLAKQRESSFRAIDWELAHVVVPKDVPVDLTTFVEENSAYGSFLNADGNVNVVDLQFKDIDVVDLVSNAS